MQASTDGDDNLVIARRYFEAIERRADPEVIAQLLDPALVQEEYPNRLNPRGARSDRATMLERLLAGRRLLSCERYEIVGAQANGDRAALEVQWSGTLAAPLGKQLPAGFTMRARFAVFLEFREGKIVAQRNYDCFEPW